MQNIIKINQAMITNVLPPFYGLQCRQVRLTGTRNVIQRDQEIYCIFCQLWRHLMWKWRAKSKKDCV